MVAFNEFHCRNSPLVQKTWKRCRWGGAAVVFALTLFITAGSLAVRIPCSLIGAGIYYALTPRYFMSTMRRQAAKLYAEGDDRGFLCEHELEATPTGLIERSPYNESRTAWAAVERIQTSSDYIFIYTGAILAHVVPRQRIPATDLAAFLEAVKTYYHPTLRISSKIEESENGLESPEVLNQ